MVIEACTCDEGAGLAHSHEGRVVMVEHLGDRWNEWQHTGVIRLWVDWKKVARVLLIDGPETPSLHASMRDRWDADVPVWGEHNDGSPDA